MKIALVTPYEISQFSGVNSHVINLAKEFRVQGHDVHILAPCDKRRTDLSGIPFFSLGRSYPIPAGGSVAQLSLSVWKHRGIKRYLKQESFDVVHAHEPFNPVPVWNVMWASPTVNVATFHAYNEATRRLLVFKPVLNLVDRTIHGRIAVSTAAHSFVSSHFPGDYSVIPNGVDVSHFSNPRSRLPEFDDGKINILFVGRAESRKGLIYLIGALARLKWRNSNVRLIVAGPGNPDDLCAQYVVERGVQHDVVFVGSPAWEDLPSYHHSADIFCTPATGRESFGLVLAEGMAAGLPVVATNIAGHASVAEDGNSAILVPPKDETALADALQSLVEDAALRQRYATAGQEVAQQYRWDRVSERVMAKYEATISTVKGNSPHLPPETQTTD